jgi:hypothetical protein
MNKLHFLMTCKAFLKLLYWCTSGYECASKPIFFFQAPNMVPETLGFRGGGAYWKRKKRAKAALCFRHALTVP